MKKPLIGMVHLQPLPSHSATGAQFEQVLAAAITDARALAAGGVDGVIVENIGDAPFYKGTKDDPVSPDVVAALAVVAREVRCETGLQVGINCLRNDAIAALGAAAVAEASWVRVNVLSGTYVTDQGIIDGEAARVMAYRRQLGYDVQLLADLWVKHATPLAPLDPVVAAKDMAERSGADVLVVSGVRTGEPVDVEFLDAVKGAVGGFPVWIGSGLTVEAAPSLWSRCDGAIVGMAFKKDGVVTNPVDVARVRQLRELWE